MSKHDSSLSKEQYNLLKSFLKSKSLSLTLQVLPSRLNPKFRRLSNNRKMISLCFVSQMQGVQKMDAGNIAKIESTAKKKPDAQTLVKRAAAMGPMQTDDTFLSDTQAMLSPVGSQSSLSYRIVTLQHKVFEDLKAGNLRWFEAVDLHGCTINTGSSFTNYSNG